MKQVDTDNFAKEVFINKPVIVAFGYAGCGPCRILKKELDQLEAADGVKVVNVDINESPELAVQYDIATVPTTLFFARGHERVVLKGMASTGQLRAQLQNAYYAGEENPVDENIIVPAA